VDLGLDPVHAAHDRALRQRPRRGGLRRGGGRRRAAAPLAAAAARARVVLGHALLRVARQRPLEHVVQRALGRLLLLLLGRRGGDGGRRSAGRLATARLGDPAALLLFAPL